MKQKEPAFTVWFTGMSGSGKSTLAALLHHEFSTRGLHAQILDGADIRRTISDDLGWTKEDRVKHIRRMGEVCDLLCRNGIIAIAAAVSPSREARITNRNLIKRYVEVYCRCPMNVLIERDRTGFYQRALAGAIKHVAGIDDQYEEPDTPEVVIDTDQVIPQQAVARILHQLEVLGYIATASAPRIYSDEEEQLIKDNIKRLN